MGLKRVVDISDIPEIPEDQHNLLGLLLIGLLLAGIVGGRARCGLWGTGAEWAKRVSSWGLWGTCGCWDRWR